jgi:hypothetical protein
VAWQNKPYITRRWLIIAATLIGKPVSTPLLPTNDTQTQHYTCQQIRFGILRNIGECSRGPAESEPTHGVIFRGTSLPSTMISFQADQSSPNSYIALDRPSNSTPKVNLARLSRVREHDTLTYEFGSSVVRARKRMTECLADPKRGRSYQHQPQSIKLR